MNARIWAAALAAMVTAAEARAFAPEEDAQVWAPTFVNLPAKDGWVGLLEVNPRARGDFERLSQLIVRPWVGRRLAPGAFVHAGYGWVRGDAARVTSDHLVWQQAQMTRSPAKGWTATGRARLEQRFLDGARGTAWRARAQVRGERALARRLYAAAYSETFVHLNTVPGGPKAGFDQHRGFIGLGRDGERAKIEFGYQHFKQRVPGRPDRVLHCLLLNSFLWPWGGR